VASLFDRVSKIMRSPQGQRIVQQASEKAQQLSKDPATRARVQKVRDQVVRRVGGRSAAGPTRPAGEQGPPQPPPPSER
jgi:hypothetical protein